MESNVTVFWEVREVPWDNVLEDGSSRGGDRFFTERRVLVIFLGSGSFKRETVVTDRLGSSSCHCVSICVLLVSVRHLSGGVESRNVCDSRST